MSYTRSYSTSVNVHGSKTVHYPASEHGGTATVTFDETVPIDISVTVETDPFDKSVRNVGANVDGLTASVTTMNAVNCAAISENSEKVSRSLIKGFYSLINNDISMKKSENNSQLQSKMALLLELSRDMQDKHIRMSEDVERLRAHYSAIFRDLDSDLDKRTKDIDRDSFRLGEKVRDEVVFKPYRTVGASTSSELGAEGQANGSITIARIRHKVSEVLDIMSDYIKKNLLYRRMMKDTLWNEYSDEDELLYIPVAYFVSESPDSKQMCEKYFVSDCKNAQNIISSVNSYVCSELESEGKSIPEEEFRLIDQAFSSMVEERFIQQDNTDKFNERVYSEILRMWNSNKPHLKQI